MVPIKTCTMGNILMNELIITNQFTLVLNKSKVRVAINFGFQPAARIRIMRTGGPLI